MNPWNIIQELEANSSTLAKQEIIKANIDNERLIAGATKCLDPTLERIDPLHRMCRRRELTPTH